MKKWFTYQKQTTTETIAILIVCLLSFPMLGLFGAIALSIVLSVMLNYEKSDKTPVKNG